MSLQMTWFYLEVETLIRTIKYYLTKSCFISHFAFFPISWILSENEKLYPTAVKSKLVDKDYNSLLGDITYYSVIP